MMTRRRTPRALSVALISLIATSTAAEAADRRVSFVSCPIMRDTRTVPCWLADNGGKRYFLVVQVDSNVEVSPPSLGHRTLVEGTETDEQYCGGTVLKDLKVSILPDRDPACNEVLPATDAYVVENPVRGTGPREKLEVLRAKGLRSDRPRPVRQPPTPPYKAQEFTIQYHFDWQLAANKQDMLGNAIEYARAINASRVIIRGYRATTPLSNGTTLEEKPFVARRRAQVLAETFVKVRFPEDRIKTQWVDEPLRGDGTQDWALRKATILVEP
jgi:hypothetical protein